MPKISNSLPELNSPADQGKSQDNNLDRVLEELLPYRESIKGVVVEST